MGPETAVRVVGVVVGPPLLWSLRHSHLLLLPRCRVHFRSEWAFVEKSLRTIDQEEEGG